jgi:hypothetical protein
MEATFAWEVSDGATGYKLYYGFESRQYEFVIDNWRFTQATVANLDDDRTYYFAVTAYNDYGESDFSKEIVFNANASACAADIDRDDDTDGFDLNYYAVYPTEINLAEFALKFGRSHGSCVAD